MIDAVPSEHADLTAEWLSDALGQAGYGTVAVASVDVQPIGTGQTGATFRVSVSYLSPRPELPATFVAKIPVPDLAIRTRVAPGCKAEVEFYQRLAETLKVPVPKCYFSAIANDGAAFVLLMADLAPAIQGDQLKGCSPLAARPAATALAGLHGPRWCDPEWLRLRSISMPSPDEKVARAVARFASKATEEVLSGLGRRMTSLDRTTLEQFPNLVANWLLLFPDRFSLLHGDYRLDNLMFDPTGQKVTVVDWQTISVGLPARDLAYFVSTSLSPRDRRDHEMNLVSNYHTALSRFDVPDYSLVTCELDYRIGMLQGPLIATLGWANSSATDRGNAMVLTMLERALGAIRDLESFQLVAELAGAS
jgi:hypothetical protein